MNTIYSSLAGYTLVWLPSTPPWLGTLLGLWIPSTPPWLVTPLGLWIPSTPPWLVTPLGYGYHLLLLGWLHPLGYEYHLPLLGWVHPLALNGEYWWSENQAWHMTPWNSSVLSQAVTRKYSNEFSIKWGGGLIRGNYGFLRNKVNSVYWIMEENNHQLGSALNTIKPRKHLLLKETLYRLCILEWPWTLY